MILPAKDSASDLTKLDPDKSTKVCTRNSRLSVKICTHLFVAAVVSHFGHKNSQSKAILLENFLTNWLPLHFPNQPQSWY